MAVTVNLHKDKAKLEAKIDALRDLDTKEAERMAKALERLLKVMKGVCVVMGKKDSSMARVFRREDKSNKPKPSNR